MNSASSIFDSAKINPKLDKLFKTKVAENVIETNENVESTSEAVEKEEAKKQDKKSKKKEYLDPVESEKRTVFIGNLVKECKKEDLKKLFRQYGKIETIRFRNIIPEDITKSKKYAFITHQQNSHLKTMNAYIRFESVDSATRAADEANGMEFKKYHLRVDLANKNKQHDNKTSVFLGGLPFDITDEDIYKHFNNCGQIDYVRVIRDNKTGVGKGFGYCKFKDTDSISLALRLNESKLNGRTIRVTRCVKKVKGSSNNNKKSTKPTTTAAATYNNNNKYNSTKKFNNSKDYKERKRTDDVKKKKNFQSKNVVSTNNKFNKKLRL